MSCTHVALFSFSWYSERNKSFLIIQNIVDDYGKGVCVMFGGGRADLAQVINGRIRVKCPHCKKNIYQSVAPGTMQKYVRCRHCKGAKTWSLDNRKHRRESETVLAEIRTNELKISVYLCDQTPYGIGFNVKKRGDRTALGIGQNAILVRKGCGEKKIRIKNNNGIRFGAEILNPTVIH